MFKKIIGGAIVAGFTATLAFAAMSGDDMIKARQTQMKANGKAMGELAKIYKGEMAFDAAAVKAQIDAMGAAYGEAEKAGAWLPESAKGETVETWAKPELWSDVEGSKATGMAMGAAMGKVAGATDEAGFKAAFEELGGACKGCHEKFRRPKEG